MGKLKFPFQVAKEGKAPQTLVSVDVTNKFIRPHPAEFSTGFRFLPHLLFRFSIPENETGTAARVGSDRCDCSQSAWSSSRSACLFGADAIRSSFPTVNYLYHARDSNQASGDQTENLGGASQSRSGTTLVACA